ncbi:MAG: hypothetical protein SGI91_09155 [Alphaproteobacteria bacterium]|nr:hypothetical protein [Alphaproteobacteria bacterium]
MANEPSAVGMIILTGMTIAAVVGLYAYDVIPRRDGIVQDTNIAWPRWQSNDAAPPPEPVQTQSPQPPAYSQQPAYSQPNNQQYPQQDQGGYSPPQQGNDQNQPPQDQRGQVPDDQQGSDAGAGQPPPPDYSQRQ